MSQVPEFEELLDQLQVAQWKDEAVGQRDAMVECPVHGGSDSGHLSERNGKALYHCFSCGAGMPELLEALEQSDEREGREALERFRDARLRAKQAKTSAPGPKAAPPVPGESPLDWYSAYVRVPRDVLEQKYGMGETTDGWVTYSWPTTSLVKMRRARGTDRTWSTKGGNQPRLWPPVERWPQEMWLVEGETDAIVMREHYGIQHAYSAGGADQQLSEDEFRELLDRGVERVVFALDGDPAGRKGLKSALKAAREALMPASVAYVGDPLLGGPKDWHERWLSGDHSTPEAGYAATTLVVPGRDIVATPQEPLLCGWVHPHDHTVLFGDGGTGKGVIAAYWAAELTRQGLRVLVVDYEQHASHEWKPRMDAFGADHDAWLAMQPTRPIWDEAATVRSVIDDQDVDLVIVDSAVYACAGTDAESSAAASQYSLAIAQFRKPVLTLAHVTKESGDPTRPPSHPFGSVFWSNGARVTVRVSRTSDELTSDRRIEVRKSNQGQVPEPLLVEWDWTATQAIGTPRKGATYHELVFRKAPAQVQVASQAAVEAGVLEWMLPGEELGNGELVRRLSENGVPCSSGTLLAVLKGLCNVGKLEKVGTSARGTRYRLPGTAGADPGHVGE